MLRRNVSGQFLGFKMISTASGAGAAGLTVSASRSIDNGAAATATGTISDKGNGQYVLAMSAADTNGNNISFFFTATGAIPDEKTIVTTAANPSDATAFGLTNLDAAISTRSTYAGGDTAGTGTLLSRLSSTRAGYLDNLSAGAVALAGSSPSWYTAPSNIDPWATALPGSYSTGTAGSILGGAEDFTGTATAGGASTITLANGTGDVTGRTIILVGGTGKDQSRKIASMSGLVATVDSAWAVQPDTTTKYVFGATANGHSLAAVQSFNNTGQSTALPISLGANAPTGWLNAAAFATNAISTQAVASVASVGDKIGYKLAADGLDAVVVETGLNARQSLSIIGAGEAGGITGNGTGTVVVKGAGVGTTRITATMLGGDRTVVILNPPA